MGEQLDASSGAGVSGRASALLEVPGTAWCSTGCRHGSPTYCCGGPCNNTQAPLAAAQYLQQLPVAVIRNGQVVNVRADIEALLKAPPSTPPSTSHVATTSDGTAAAGDGVAESTTLRVKGEDGAHTYVIKLAADATIGHLRRHLDRHRCVLSADFSLRLHGYARLPPGGVQGWRACPHAQPQVAPPVGRHQLPQGSSPYLLRLLTTRRFTRGGRVARSKV